MGVDFFHGLLRIHLSPRASRRTTPDCRKTKSALLPGQERALLCGYGFGYGQVPRDTQTYRWPGKHDYTCRAFIYLYVWQATAHASCSPMDSSCISLSTKACRKLCLSAWAKALAATFLASLSAGPYKNCPTIGSERKALASSLASATAIDSGTTATVCPTCTLTLPSGHTARLALCPVPMTRHGLPGEPGLNCKIFHLQVMGKKYNPAPVRIDRGAVVIFTRPCAPRLRH